MTNDQLFQVVVLALIGTATAVVGWLQARRLGVAAVQQTLNDTNRDLVAAMNTQLALRDLQLEDLDRRLKRCEKRAAAEKRLRIEARRRTELIG